ncbi:transporter [Leptospira perolatii]|uniref:Transporter n=1 Tax=Leptospira perolatii TaxID=2023191 RepID=A0A2M9ZLL4_9LEPT|nr:transporter [Leptospira perolatii]PJZ69827.1 transporter [Leptospira perolatii]PJZ72958.1 transporter [Leptospira perolatii]
MNGANGFLFAFLFGLIAAVGNAIFAFGQKKSENGENPFLFLSLTVVTCLFILLLSTLFFPKDEILSYIKRNLKWSLISGIGLSITYLGFYLLYSRFGASYYILYAVLSVLTTSFLLGIIVLKENFNIYYGLSVISSFITIFLYYLGKKGQ